MRPAALQPVVLAIAEERTVGGVLGGIVQRLAGQDGVALARVWLLAAGDICSTCRMRPDCPDQSRCLHLMASAGTSLDSTQPWAGLDGAFRRVPLGVGKVGKVGASGSGILLHDMSASSAWIAHPDWAAREGMRSFAAQPLVLRGETLGVLAVFSRARIDAAAFGWLRGLADHAAVAIANARAFEEIERLRAQLEAENGYMRTDLREHVGRGGIVGTSPATQALLQQIELVAPTDAAVLIVGESGTGKGLVAHRVHERSRRAERALLTVDCAAIAPELFERELFGHVRGAFAGAEEDRVGRVEAADRGTLILDEVGAIPLELQNQLLRVLQEGEFERVGEGRTRGVDVRVVATTNRDLRAEVAAGRFREDLYFRLSLLTLRVPPLRERPRDVGALVAHFLRQSDARRGGPPRVASRQDLRALERCDWPGNVRELASVVERASILAVDGAPRFELPGSTPGAGPGAHDDVLTAEQWRRRERGNVEAALARSGGRVYGRDGAADLLGVPPTTLASRMKALGIERSAR